MGRHTWKTTGIQTWLRELWRTVCTLKYPQHIDLALLPTYQLQTVCIVPDVSKNSYDS